MCFCIFHPRPAGAGGCRWAVGAASAGRCRRRRRRVPELPVAPPCGAERSGGGRRVSPIARPGTRRRGGRGEARSLPAAAEGSRAAAAAAAAPREVFAWEEGEEIPFPLLARYLGAGSRLSSRRGAQPPALPPPPAARPSGGYEGVSSQINHGAALLYQLDFSGTGGRKKQAVPPRALSRTGRAHDTRSGLGCGSCGLRHDLLGCSGHRHKAPALQFLPGRDAALALLLPDSSV